MKPEFSELAISVEDLTGESEEDEGSDSEAEYSEEYEDNNMDDGERCKEGFYWHIRGNNCVPLNCPSRKRDPMTGKCRQISSSYRNFNQRPQGYR